MPTRHRAQKHTYLGLEYEKSEILLKNLKDAHTNSVRNGCDTFPNELVWFQIEATPIWKNIQKYRANAVIC